MLKFGRMVKMSVSEITMSIISYKFITFHLLSD